MPYVQLLSSLDLQSIQGMSEPQRQYPVICQKCQKETGFPFQVRTLSEQPGHIEIKIRCRECATEWIEVVSSRE